MIFALGFIAGGLCVGFSMLAATIYAPTIQRTTNQITSRLKPKGAIIEPEPDDLKDWVKSIEKDV